MTESEANEMRNIAWRLERANRSERKGYWMVMYRRDIEFLLNWVARHGR